jgi:acyl carrier protein
MPPSPVRHLNELQEWAIIRQTLAERTHLTAEQLEQIGQAEGDSLDLVELLMGLEESFKIKFPF